MLTKGWILGRNIHIQFARFSVFYELPKEARFDLWAFFTTR
jgi:hypothetical protein